MSITVQDVVNVLRDGRTQLIVFSVPTPTVTVEVNGTTFGRVADAIETGRVMVSLPPHFPPLPAGVNQYYQAPWRSPTVGPHNEFYRIAANTLRVTSVATIDARALLLHECVHASLDLTVSPPIPPAYEEAACYVAQLLYIRASYVGRVRIGVSTGASVGRVAMRAAELIRARQPVPRTLMDEIAAAVRADPLYAHIADPDAPSLTHDG